MRKITLLTLILMFLVNIIIVEAIGEYTEEDYFIEWEFPQNLNTPHIYTGGVITVNFTVLPISLSNVSLLAPASDRYDWSPIPCNITLQPGEHHSDTFTLLRGISGGGFLSYSAIVYEENASATVRFGYKVINIGSKPASLPAGIILFSFIFISVHSLMKREKRKKSDGAEDEI